MDFRKTYFCREIESVEPELVDFKLRLRLASVLFRKALKGQKEGVFTDEIGEKILGKPNRKVVGETSDNFLSSKAIAGLLTYILNTEPFPESIEFSLGFYSYLLKRGYIGGNRPDIIEFFIKETLNRYEFLPFR